MVHAGVLPSWNAVQTITLAQEAQKTLAGPRWPEFAPQMYGNHPDEWRDDLTGPDRLRVIINALTRLRICTPGGAMRLNYTGAPTATPAGTLPWYAAPDRQTQTTPIVYGHWSAQGTASTQNQNNTYCIDTGCLWGHKLTALNLATLRQHHTPAAQ